MPGPLAAVGGFVSGQIVNPGVNALGGGFFTGIGQIGNYHCPNGLIDWATASQLFRTEAIDGNAWNEHRRYQGMQGDATEGPQTLRVFKGDANGVVVLDDVNITGNKHINDRAIQFGKNWPTVDECLTLVNRGLMTNDAAFFVINQLTGGEHALNQAMFKLRYQIPGPSDLISFAVRDCFSPQIVETFQYNKELPVDILPYMAANGLHGQINMPMPPNSTTTVGPDNRQHPQWFDLYWWSHWVLPSVGQGFEMLHRLYLNSPFGAAPGVTPGNEFNQSHLDILLKAQDYPPFWRQRLTDISYLPLTRVDVRRMYDLDVVTEVEVYHAYRAIGYDNVNALRLTDFTKQLSADKLTKKVRDGVVKETHDLYMMGAVNDQDASVTLLANQIKQTVIPAYLKLWKLQRQRIEINESIKYIKSGYILGTLSTFEAQTALKNIGLPQKEVVAYTSLWDKIKYSKRKFISAATNEKHYTSGMISQNQFVMKLTNLNFDNDEIKQMVAFANATIGSKLAKALQHAADAKAKADAKTLAAIVKPWTTSNMTKWFKNGSITLNDVYIALRLQGWVRKAIVAYMEEALKATLPVTTMTQIDKLSIGQEEIKLTTKQTL